MPYAIVSMVSAFINVNTISPKLATVPALFAKSSLVWPAFLNSLFFHKISKNKQFDKVLQEGSNIIVVLNNPSVEEGERLKT